MNVNIFDYETPGAAIEAQEAAGQAQFVADTTLPVNCNNCTREQLETMGITFLRQIDDLFVEIKLPNGWRKVATDHPMWSNLVDEKGRVRGGLFYKAGFRGGKAFIRIDRRFSFHVKVMGDDYDTSPYAAVVLDQDKIIWQSELESPSDDIPAYWAGERYKEDAKKWLEEHYPDWRDPLAYWD